MSNRWLAGTVSSVPSTLSVSTVRYGWKPIPNGARVLLRFVTDVDTLSPPGPSRYSTSTSTRHWYAGWGCRTQRRVTASAVTERGCQVSQRTSPWMALDRAGSLRGTRSACPSKLYRPLPSRLGHGARI